MPLSRKSAFSDVFPQNVANSKSNSKSGREMVMEHLEIVMEKSWTNLLSSLGTLLRDLI